MSTRSTLAHGDNFHLYHDLIDDVDNFYLRLNKTYYEASPDEVIVKIPPDIWETIRQVSVNISYADKTDEELQHLAEQEVDERIKEYKKANKDKRSWLNICGCAVYGYASDPRQQQIDNGLIYFKNLRKKHLAIKEAMKNHKIY